MNERDLLAYLLRQFIAQRDGAFTTCTTILQRIESGTIVTGSDVSRALEEIRGAEHADSI